MGFHSGGTRNARYVRLYIQTFSQHPSMRADVLVQSASGKVTCGDCQYGYVNDGPTGCKLADKCKTNNGGCDKKRKCSFKNGRVTCGDCPSGFVNNGVNGCRDNPCKNHNGGCHAARKCTSSKDGRVTCGNCPAGYVNNGVNSCSKVADPCKTNNGGCDKKRKCTSKGGKATCGNCPAGFTNNGAKGCKQKVTGPCAKNNGGCHKARKCTAKYFKGSKKWRVSCGNCPAGFKNRGKMDCRQDMMAGVKCIDSACRERGKPLAGLVDDDPDCCAHPKDAYCDPGFTLSFITEAEWAKIPLGHRPAAFGYCMDHGHIGNTCCTFDGGPVHSVADPCKTNNGGCHAARKCTNKGGEVRVASARLVLPTTARRAAQNLLRRANAATSFKAEASLAPREIYCGWEFHLTLPLTTACRSSLSAANLVAEITSHILPVEAATTEAADAGKKGLQLCK